MVSIKKNFAYSSALTIANYIFPLIVYPYISRVLGVTNIGICNFIDSIINYFILFSMMGINTMALREVAKSRNNKQTLSSTFSNILILNTISTIIVLVILLVLTFTIPKLTEYKDMMIIGGVKVLFNYLLIEWLYKGLENFKYITLRTISVRFFYVISVFIFVHKAEDYPIFYLLTTIMTIVNAVINLSHSRKYVTFKLSNINLKPYLSSFFILGFYSLLTSTYIAFNIMYLGFVSGETEVGYYTTATKLQNIILALYSAFTGVMLPRLSSLYAQNEIDEVKRLCHKSVDILFLFIFPLIVITVTFAPQIITLLFGPGYEKSIPLLQLSTPLLFIIGYEQILVIQILMSMKKDKAVMINSSLASIVAIIGNILIVPKLQSLGSIIVWILCELTIFVSANLFAKKYIKFFFPFKKLAKYILITLPIFVIAYFLSMINILHIFNIIIGVIVVFVYYFIVYVVIMKNDFIVSLIDKVKIRIHL